MPDSDWKFEVGPIKFKSSVKGVSERMAMGFGIAAMVCVTAVVITVLVLVLD